MPHADAQKNWRASMKTNERDDAMQFYMTGAISDGNTQPSPDLSKGKFRSSKRSHTLEWFSGNEMPGVSMVYASRNNGPGTGLLAADGAGFIRWRPPGERLSGPRQELARSSLAVVPGRDPSKFVVVSRSSAINDLRGQMVVGLIEKFSTVISGPETIDPQGVSTFRCECFKNAGSVKIRDLRSWIVAVGQTTVRESDASTGATVIRTNDALWEWPGGIPGDDGGFGVWNATRPEFGFYKNVLAPGGVPDTLSITAKGRDLWGGTDTGPAWVVGDVLYCVPPVRFAYEAPSSQPAGSFFDGTGGGGPALTFVTPVAEAEADAAVLAELLAGNIGARWFEVFWPSDARGRAHNRFEVAHSYRT